MIVSDKMHKVLEHYNRGLQCYKSHQFTEALREFKKSLDLLPGDGPSAMYIERCEAFIKNPPPADWDGVFTMTTK